MTINVGDRIPEATLTLATEEGPRPITTQELFGGRKVALFAVPGAFTPTCSAKHLPGFVEKASDIKGKGVDAIACLSVNDAFVMNQWARSQELANVRVIPDGSAEFTEKVGMLVRKDNVGFGCRSWRYAAVVDDGVIERLFVEPGKCDNHPEDPYGESSPEAILAYLRDRARAAA